MIWKLTGFELKKSLSGRFFPVALVVLLLLDLMLLSGLPEWLEFQLQLQDGTLSELDVEDKGFWEYTGNGRRASQYAVQEYTPFIEATPEERQAFASAMVEKYGPEAMDTFFPTGEMMNIPGYFGGELSDFEYIQVYNSLLEQNETLQSELDGVLHTAKLFGREAVAHGDNYGIRRNAQILRLYSEPRGEITGVVRGWDGVLFENPSMLLWGFLILLTTVGSFAGELDRGTHLILQTARNGKTKTLLAKYLAGALTAVGLTLVFFAASVLALWFRKGFLGITQPMSVLLPMCPYPMTVWQFLLLTLGLQCFAAITLSILLNTISALSRGSLAACAWSAIFLAGCLVLCHFPPKLEILAGPLAVSRTERFFQGYYTGNVCTFPIPWVVLHLITWTLVDAGAMVLADRVYHRKRRSL